jgi:hypothetical protein
MDATCRQVKLVNFNEVAAKAEYPFEIANYVGGSKTKGLTVYECACQAHCFALAWNDEAERFVSHQISPIRRILEEKGFKPEKPVPSPHVVIIDYDDASILTQRRWRALPTKAGHRARWFLQAGRRAIPAQRMLFPKAECISFLNGCGLDLRRCNLRRTTLKKLLRDRNKRQGWAAREAEKKSREKVAA